jgi:hypothetical protein
MQIRGSKRGDKRSTWLIGYMWEGGKRERMLLSMIGKSIMEKIKGGLKTGHLKRKSIRKREI